MKLAEKSNEEIMRVTTPIMDNLMQGSTEISHEKHTRDFTARMKGIVTKEHLEKVCNRYLVAELVLVEQDSRVLVDHAMVY